MSDLTHPPSAPAAAPPPGPPPRRLDSIDLLGGDREVLIVHRGQVYRLRVTKADKLILTK